MFAQIVSNKLFPYGASLLLVAALSLPTQANPAASTPPQQATGGSVTREAPQPAVEAGDPAEEDATGSQDRFNGLLADLEREERGNYASAVWKSDRQANPTISFVKDPGEATAEKIAELGFPVDIVTGAPLDAEGYDQELEEAFDAVTSDNAIESASGWIDPETSIIHIEYQIDDAAKLTRTAEAQLDKKVVSKAPAVPGFRYEIRQTDDAPTQQLTRGGKKFGTCTTGFTVYQGGSRGVLTAAHCDNYARVPAGTTVKADYRTEHRGSYGDFQWHSTLDTISNYIQISSTATRKINSEGIAGIGSSICNFGMTRTKSSCGTVKSQAACVKFSGMPTNTCRLVVVNGTFSNAGDSGGPWYANNRAYGIHTGANSTQMYYSRVGNAEAILGLILKLS